jgi:hypothetical protein
MGVSDHSPTEVVVGNFKILALNRLNILVFGLRMKNSCLWWKEVGVSMWMV